LRQQQHLQTFNGTPDFGTRSSVTLTRFGDIIRIPVVVTLPSIWEVHQPPSPMNISHIGRGGSIMQLVAYGAQDRMLTVNTAVTLHQNQSRQQQEPRRTFNERTRSNQERFAYGRRQFHRK
jgi:hypothetical protein